VKRLSIGAAVLGAVGLATAFALWVLPANEFILTPDRAKPLADRVEVEGARPAGGGDVYYVDVFVRRSSLLESLLPFTRPDGSTVLPERALLPPGTSQEERDRQNAAEMNRSERIASVVALRALGYDIEATPKGALVIGVATGAPASTKIEPGDVVVAVDDTSVRTPDELRREIGRREPGRDVRLTVERAGTRLQLTVGTVPSPDEPSRPIVGIQVDQEVDIDLPIEIDIARQCPLPGIKKINLTMGGCGAFNCVVSIEKKFEGYGKMIALAVLGTWGARFVKTLIIVDDDIDPFDWNQVEWALATRVQPHRDVEIIRDIVGCILDPSLPYQERQTGRSRTSKMIIDATKYDAAEFEVPCRPKQDVAEKVNREWAKYGIGIPSGSSRLP